MPKRKYKGVNSPEKSWVNETTTSGETYRAEVKTGSNGGKYFENSEGIKVYCSNLSNQVEHTETPEKLTMGFLNSNHNHK